MGKHYEEVSRLLCESRRWLIAASLTRPFYTLTELFLVTLDATKNNLASA